jgi:hypothetical protein
MARTLAVPARKIACESARMILFMVLTLTALPFSGKTQHFKPGNSSKPPTIQIPRELSSPYRSYQPKDNNSNRPKDNDSYWLKDDGSRQCPFFQHCLPNQLTRLPSTPAQTCGSRGYFYDRAYS